MRKVGHGLNNREAIDIHPERRVDRSHRAGHAELRLDAPLNGGNQIGASHVLERPLCFQVFGELLHGDVKPPAERDRLVGDDRREAGTGFLVEVWKGEHLDGCADVAERRPGAFKQRLQQLILVAAGLDRARDVLECEDEARDRRTRIENPARPGPGSVDRTQWSRRTAPPAPPPLVRAARAMCRGRAG